MSGSLTDHDHEWDDSPEVFLEDFTATVVQSCLWAEVVSQVHSEKHDETFYGYGQECDERRVLTFHPSEAIVSLPVADHLLAVLPGQQFEPGGEASKQTVEFPQQREEWTRLHRRLLESIEQAWSKDAITDLDVDPEPDHGYVFVRSDRLAVSYEPIGE